MKPGNQTETVTYYMIITTLSGFLRFFESLGDIRINWQKGSTEELPLAADFGAGREGGVLLFEKPKLINKIIFRAAESLMQKLMKHNQLRT